MSFYIMDNSNIMFYNILISLSQVILDKKIPHVNLDNR